MAKTKNSNNTKNYGPPPAKKKGSNTVGSRKVQTKIAKVKTPLVDYFHQDYEFCPPHSVRSPVGKHEHTWKTKHSDYGYAPFNASVKELHLLQARPHGFHHTDGQKTGRLRLSGHPGAHQVGRRSGKKREG